MGHIPLRCIDGVGYMARGLFKFSWALSIGLRRWEEPVNGQVTSWARKCIKCI